jgi:hypothetical protein
VDRRAGWEVSEQVWTQRLEEKSFASEDIWKTTTSA